MNLLLKKGREKSLKRRHPWIFSGAVEKVNGKPGGRHGRRARRSKETARARGLQPQVADPRARLDFRPVGTGGRSFFRTRIQTALAVREALPAAKHANALRLVHGESDALPGLVVDRYADVLVAQFLAAGVERWRDRSSMR